MIPMTTSTVTTTASMAPQSTLALKIALPIVAIMTITILALIIIGCIRVLYWKRVS